VKCFYVDGLLTRSAVPVALLLFLGQGCAEEPTQPNVPDAGDSAPPVPPADGGVAPPSPPVLPTFISADELQYHVIDGEEEEEEEVVAEEEEEEAAETLLELEESDIYRILPDGTLVNLNYFRGLQIIDMNNAEQPAIVGRLHFDAEPTELLVTGSHAIVLASQRQRG
jgi:hypothetical protein